MGRVLSRLIPRIAPEIIICPKSNAIFLHIDFSGIKAGKKSCRNYNTSVHRKIECVYVLTTNMQPSRCMFNIKILQWYTVTALSILSIDSCIWSTMKINT